MYADRCWWRGEREKNGGSGNATAATETDLLSSQREKTMLGKETTTALENGGFGINFLEVGESEKGGGISRGLVAEIF